MPRAVRLAGPSRLPGPHPGDDAVRSVGRRLAELRRLAGISGLHLARTVGASQSKISRIENGVVIPSPGDVSRIAAALGAEPDVVKDLMEAAESAQEQLRDWRATGHRLSTSQDDVSRHEARARSIRTVQIGIVAGLLQTDEYARGVLAAFAKLTGEDEAAAAEAVARRLARQKILYDGVKSFTFVIMENVLNYWPCSPEAMLVQLSRIREVADRKNVEVRIVRVEQQLDFPAIHGFVLFDDRTVVIDLANTAVFTHGANDIKMYERLYDSYRAASVPCTDEILAPYRRRATEQLSHPTAATRAPHGTAPS